MERKGYPEPGYTQTPNLLFDEHMRDMSEVELKVVLCAIRKTLGWHKQLEPISLTQFQHLTGLSRKGVLLGIERAIERGVLQPVGNGLRGAVIYQLCLFKVTGEQNTPVENNQAKSYTSTGEEFTPELVYKIDTQKKERKERKKDSASTASGSRPRNLLFDAVARHLFGAAENDSAAVKAVAPSVNKLVTFLKARPVEVAPEAVSSFAAWCIARKQDMKFMRYLATFTPAWLEYETARASVPAPAVKPAPEADKTVLRPSLKDGMVQL